MRATTHNPLITSRQQARMRHLAGWMLLCAGAVLLANQSHAQTAAPTPSLPVPAPYAAKDVERAFSFMDANKDGRINREEAAGFRGVARHFVAADSNRDNALSLAEFESALNRKKPAEPAAKTALSRSQRN